MSTLRSLINSNPSHWKQWIEPNDLNPRDKMDINPVLHLLNEEFLTELKKVKKDGALAGLYEYLVAIKNYYDAWNDNTVSNMIDISLTSFIRFQSKRSLKC